MPEERTPDVMMTPASDIDPSQTLQPEDVDLVKSGDQGIWYNQFGSSWPVLVLRGDMVPDQLRETHHKDTVPVLLFGKMDMYVKVLVCG